MSKARSGSDKARHKKTPATKTQASAKRDPAGLTEADRALWQQVTQTLTPVDQLKPRIQDMAARLPPEDARWPDGDGGSTDDHVKKPNPTLAKTTQPRAVVMPSYKPPHSAPKSASSRDAPLAPFEKKAARKLGRGSVRLDGRIDLHGLRQTEAHEALRRFLAAKFAGDARWVLVITGKGQRAYGAEHGSHAAEDVLFGRTEPGVLRRMVPQWLAEPDLRLFVVSYREAAPQHGGTGALYVQMRRRKT